MGPRDGAYTGKRDERGRAKYYARATSYLHGRSCKLFEFNYAVVGRPRIAVRRGCAQGELFGEPICRHAFVSFSQGEGRLGGIKSPDRIQTLQHTDMITIQRSPKPSCITVPGGPARPAIPSKVVVQVIEGAHIARTTCDHHPRI